MAEDPPEDPSPHLRRLAVLDRVVHEPVRLALLMALANRSSVDFGTLLEQLGVTRGNLSSHLGKLEATGYVAIARSFRGRRPQTDYRITSNGRDALGRYLEALAGSLAAL